MSKKTQKLPEQQNYLLRSGMGTVSADDYDPDVHGPVVIETEEQYEARISGVKDPSRRPINPVLPTAPANPTTIQNLHTYDPSQVKAPAPPPRRLGAVGAPPPGVPVAVANQKGKVSGDVAETMRTSSHRPTDARGNEIPKGTTNVPEVEGTEDEDKDGK